MGKSERRKRVEKAVIPLTHKRVVTTLRPQISGKTPETQGSPVTPGKTRKLQHLKS
jgi:hypothetical protein